MAFSSYSTDPDSNSSINGTNVAENCAAANINNAIRQIMADGKELANTVAAIDVSGKLSTTGGTVTGNIVRSGAGSHLYHAGAPGGGVHILATGAALPTTPEGGTIVFFY